MTRRFLLDLCEYVAGVLNRCVVESGPDMKATIAMLEESVRTKETRSIPAPNLPRN